MVVEQLHQDPAVAIREKNSPSDGNGNKSGRYVAEQQYVVW